MINQEYESPLKDVMSYSILGGQEIVDYVRDKYLSGNGVKFLIGWKRTGR